MKKYFLFIFTVIACSLGFGQINPVQNLVWNNTYDFPNYNNIFSLSWQEPETPHNTLIGYNIYRGNELYRFQSTNALGLICNSNFGFTADCDFMNYNASGAFTAYVVAVYEGGVESAYVSFEIRHILNTTEITLKPINIFPNPAKDILNFSEEVSNIRITELSGKVLKQVSNTEKSINVSKLAKGTYIISAKSKSGGLINKKFIKE